MRKEKYKTFRSIKAHFVQTFFIHDLLPNTKDIQGHESTLKNGSSLI